MIGTQLSRRGWKSFLLVPLALSVLVLQLPADKKAEGPEVTSTYTPWLFRAVVATLKEAIPAAHHQIEPLETRYRPAADESRSEREEAAVVHRLLGEIPSSHVALFSAHAHGFFSRELLGEDSPTPGFFLRVHDGRFFVSELMVGGPASLAGLERGDEVVSIDGVPVSKSPRLDARTDDAHLPDAATHLIIGEVGDTLRLDVRRDGNSRIVQCPVASYSSLRGDRAASRIVSHLGNNYGYLRLSYMYRHHTSRLMKPLLEQSFLACDGLILDIRGRGGSQIAMWAVMSMLDGAKGVWDKPIVVLVDRSTRSAKEVLARWFKKSDRATIVGERTIGATRPGVLHPVQDRYYLLCPTDPFASPRGLELKGLVPDVEVEDKWPRRGDAILAAGLESLAKATGGDPK